MNDQVPVVQVPKSYEIRMTILGVDSSVALARELVRYALINWGYGRDLIDDSTVVMSEIATNAVDAARGHLLQIRVNLDNGALVLLECWDPSPELPRATAAGLDALSGRGLAIIAAYAKDTGIRPSATGQGKIVWALMPAPDPTPPEHPTT